MLISRDSGVLQVVDLATGKVVKHKHPKTSLACAALNADATRLAFGGETRLVVVATTGETLAEHKLKNTQRVTSVQWTLGGQLLVTLARSAANGRNELLLLNADGALVRRDNLLDATPMRAALAGRVVHVSRMGEGAHWVHAYAYGEKEPFALVASKPVNAEHLFETPRGTLVNVHTKEDHRFGLLDANLEMTPVATIAGRLGEAPAASLGGERFVMLSRGVVLFSLSGTPEILPLPVEFPDLVALSRSRLAISDFKTVQVFRFEPPLS